MIYIMVSWGIKGHGRMTTIMQSTTQRAFRETRNRGFNVNFIQLWPFLKKKIDHLFYIKLAIPESNSDVSSPEMSHAICDQLC